VSLPHTLSSCILMFFSLCVCLSLFHTLSLTLFLPAFLCFFSCSLSLSHTHKHTHSLSHLAFLCFYLSLSLSITLRQKYFCTSIPVFIALSLSLTVKQTLSLSQNLSSRLLLLSLALRVVSRSVPTDRQIDNKRVNRLGRIFFNKSNLLVISFFSSIKAEAMKATKNGKIILLKKICRDLCNITFYSCN